MKRKHSGWTPGAAGRLVAVAGLVLAVHATDPEAAPGAPAAAARPEVARAEDLRGQVAFLRAGKIWILDPARGRARVLVADAKPIDSFAFSPSLARVAYTRVVGDRGEEAPDPAICEAVVYDLHRRAIVAVARPDSATDDSPRLDAWLTDDELVVERVSGFDVPGMERWNTATGERAPWPGEGREDMSWTDWAVADSTVYYTATAGVGASFVTTLRARGLRGGPPRDLASKRSLLGPCVAPDGAKLAYVEVDDAHGRDRVWVYDLASGAERVIYAGPVGGKSGSVLGWSPDSREVAVRYTNQPDVVVDCSADPPLVRASDGRIVGWLPSGDMLAMARDGAMHLVRNGKLLPAALLRDFGDAVVLGADTGLGR